MTSAPTPWKRLGIVYLAGILAAVQVGVIAPVVPLLQHDLDLSLPFVSAILSCITFVSVVLGTVAGNWTNRFGLVRAIVVGLALMTVAAGLSAVVESGGALLAIRALSGLGYLATVVACPPLIAQLANDRDRAFALALWGAFLPLGIAVAEGASALLLTDIGWRGLFWVNTAATALAGVVSMIMLRGLAPGAAPSDSDLSVWAIYRMKAPLLLMFCFGVFAFIFIVFAGVEPAYLAEARGMSVGAAGRTIALTTMLAIPGSLIAGALVRKGVAPIRLAWIGLSAPALLSILIFAPALSTPVAIAASALAMITGALIPAAVYAMIPRIEPDPKRFAPINGLLMQIGSGGTLIGPPIFAAWTDGLGWALAPVLLILISAAAMACLFAIRRQAA
ncbi:MAG TPA: MFS transporter [Magnetospirillaceae bacterium]|jgi:MFS family permease